jgi:hypothetical protein
MFGAEKPHKKSEQNIEIFNLLNENITAFFPSKNLPSKITVEIAPAESVWVALNEKPVIIGILSPSIGKKSILLKPTDTTVIVTKYKMLLPPHQKLFTVPFPAGHQ